MQKLRVCDDLGLDALETISQISAEELLSRARQGYLCRTGPEPIQNTSPHEAAVRGRFCAPDIGHQADDTREDQDGPSTEGLREGDPSTYQQLFSRRTG